MRYLRIAAIAAGLSLLLAGCGQQAVQSSAKASLEIAVQGIAQASVQVVGGGKTVFDGAVTGSKTLSLDAGTYLIDGKPLSGYQDPSPATIELKSGQTLKTALVYQQVSATPPAPVAKLVVMSVKDSAGVDLPTNKEVNSNKEVMLYASQTEEAVCVKAKATDANGAPVAGASIVVQTSELFGDHIAVIRGCVKPGQTGTMAFRDGILTDADGMALFTLYATYGSSDASLADKVLLFNQPAKIVVAAENADNSAVLGEFKVFFYNISHLYYGKEATNRRVGASFAETNLFKPLNDFIDQGHPDANEFAIQANLFTKQPQEKLDIGMWIDKHFRGMVFELVEGADKVEFVAGTYNQKLTATSVVDFDGYVRIEPKAGLGLKDLPVQAKVKATLVMAEKYGDQLYYFPLKEFTIAKKWIGTYLSISKSVDHHVLSWAGTGHNGYTLEAANDPAIAANGVFTATMTLRVKNQGTDPAYDVTVSDALPAELGVLTATATPSGATYDGTNHVMTWNWQNTPDPKFDKLLPGEEITVTMQVYLRQKPGFCWDEGDFAKTATYQVKPIAKCPTDPYKVVNGAARDDVTGTWYTGAPMGTGTQVKVDYNGSAYEKDVVVWGVRPIFSVIKKLIDPPQPMKVGNIAYFDISIQNVDRHPRYDALMSAYPEEFSGKLRDNPYGREAILSDVFDTGLDFVSAGNLNVKDDEGLNPAANYAPSFVPDKGIKWASIPLLGGGDSGTAQIALRANLPSPEKPKYAEDLKLGWKSGWYNCAFLDAKNLNQPADYQGADWDGWIEMRPWYRYPLHHNNLEALRSGIRACERVFVIQPGEPWLEVTTLGEFGSAVPDTSPITAVHQGNTYYYGMTVFNHGDAAASGVSFKVTLSGAVASFSSAPSDHYLYEWNGVSWNFVSGASSATATQVVFPNRSLDTGHVLLYFMKTKADLVGNADATGTFNYTNPGIQAPFLPDSVLESTQIAP